jgi:hypothetical protein
LKHDLARSGGQRDVQEIADAPQELSRGQEDSCENDGWNGQNVYASVPQRSIIEPLLWNQVHDGLLKELKAITRSNAVAFADELAAILNVAKQEYATTKLCTAMRVITRWCAESGMKIAQEKSEVILSILTEANGSLR